jgi:hypothetical protein
MVMHETRIVVATATTALVHNVRRAATIAGIAAALALPSVATAGSNSQVCQIKPRLKAHVVPANLKRQTAARLSTDGVEAGARIPELGDQQIPKVRTTPALCQGAVMFVGLHERYGLELYAWSTCGRSGGLRFG